MNDLTAATRQQLSDLKPYRPGMPVEELARTHGLEVGKIIKLASNENPYGMSSQTKEAARKALDEGFRYPDGHDLRVALSAHYHVPQDCLVLGNGSNDVLDLIARVFLGPETQAVSSQYAFGVYRLVTKIVGADNVVVPAQDYGHDLAAMQDALTPQTRVVWLANPNNPTGTFVDYASVEQFIAALPPQVVVVLDEAYYEYLLPEQRADTVQWLEKYPNLIIVRTFSKVYGLAGLRVGYGLMSAPVADMLNRVRQPFNVNNVAVAAAVAALADQEFVDASRIHNQDGVKQLKDGLDKLDLPYLPTNGNFITVRFANAVSVHETLLKKGIIVRPIAEYGLADHLRITVGRPEENDRLLQTLSAIEGI